MGGEKDSESNNEQSKLDDLLKLGVDKLSTEVINSQRTINIGSDNQLLNGKSALVKELSTALNKKESAKNKYDSCSLEDKTDAKTKFATENDGMSSFSESRSTSPSSSNDTNDQIFDDRSFDGDADVCKSYKLSEQKRCRLAEFNHTPVEDQKTIEKITDIIQQDKELLRAKEKSQLATDLIISKMQLKELRVHLEDISKYPIKLYQNSVKRLSTDRLHQKKPKRARNNIYEVEKIVAKKVEGGVNMYLVKWKDWGEEHNTWEPVSNLENCPELLRIFENQNSKIIERFLKAIQWFPKKQDLERHMREMINRGLTPEPEEIDRENIEYAINCYFRSKVINRTDSVQKKIQDDILNSMLLDARRLQISSLTEWEKEMNSISKGKPIIRVENVVDLESAPQDFFYIDEYLPGKGVVIPEEPPIGCECKECASPDSKDNCCFNQHGERKMNYTMGSKIRVPPGTPIYECNKRCKCPMTCPNRVVQRGACVKLCVFRTSNGTGWGVKTLRKIKRGSFVIQYVGEVITNEEAELRGKRYDAAGRTYLFDLDYNETEGQCPYTVDAAVYGNISHFINHSCEPNLAVYGVWVNCLDPNLPKLALFATRDIEQDEEITFDYMCQAGRDEEKKEPQDTSIDSTKSEPRPRLELSGNTHGDELKNRTKCKCGSKMCRQYIF